ncbi:hypothetical protein ACLOJK_003106 [Asimina triloba]
MHVRPKLEERMTICGNDSNAKGSGALSNKQIVSMVEIDSYIAGGEISELSALIVGQTLDESKENGARVQLSDLILYGADLKLTWVHFGFHQVDDEGAVLVMTGPPARERSGLKKAERYEELSFDVTGYVATCLCGLYINIGGNETRQVEEPWQVMEPNRMLEL